jgi:hypothetical protein
MMGMLRRRNIGALEMFNACDVNDDASVDVKEFDKFIEGLGGPGTGSPEFK